MRLETEMARFLRPTAVLLALLQVCSSKPVVVKRWDDLQLKHSWLEVPRGWELVGPAPADHALHMRIGLKQDRIDELISSLYQVSDPDHDRYGFINVCVWSRILTVL
jgi:tripeptidyl-peptidase-1